MLRRTFCSFSALPLLAQPGTTPVRNLILFTSDGLRRQDVFGGIDARLMAEKAAGMANSRALRDELWRETPRERREALMPYFWKMLAPRCSVSDNVKVTNAYRVSYPGYSEILTGRAQDDVIRGNDPKQNPTETFLQFARRELKLTREQVAVFASWEAFPWISESKPGSLFINSGYAESDATPRIAELSKLQWDLLTEGDTRHDWITVEMALDYLRVRKPRILYISLDETDHWAHQHNYDRYLRAMRLVDRTLEKIVNTIDSMPEYRGQTALIMTADHGRGDTLQDWSDHGARVAGADRIWLAAYVPKPPAIPDGFRQRDIAGMALRLLGLDASRYLPA